MAKLAEMPEPILLRAIGKKYAYIKIMTSSLYILELYYTKIKYHPSFAIS